MWACRPTACCGGCGRRGALHPEASGRAMRAPTAGGTDGPRRESIPGAGRPYRPPLREGRRRGRRGRCPHRPASACVGCSAAERDFVGRGALHPEASGRAMRAPTAGSHPGVLWQNRIASLKKIAPGRLTRPGRCGSITPTSTHTKYVDGNFALVGASQRAGGRCEPVPKTLRSLLPE